MRPDIDILLNKYWETETSLDEEVILKSYFLSNAVEKEHLAFTPMFVTFEALSKINDSDTNNIDAILNKYWDGVSSLKEEQLLKNYFSSSDIAAEHLVFKDLFDYLGVVNNTSSSNNLPVDNLLEKFWMGSTTIEEEEILKAYFTDKNISEDQRTYAAYFDYLELHKKIKTNTLDKPNVNDKATGGRIFTLKKWAYAAAAIFALVLGSLFLFNQVNNDISKDTLVYEIEDPEEAYKVTMEALALLSYKYQKSENVFKENIMHLNAGNILSN